MLDALRGVRWPARRAVGAAPAGTHRSTQKGTAGEFTEYRLYRQGDDPRALDWKLLARSDRAFVRLSDDRALLSTWIVVDATASMAFPAEDSTGVTRSKFAQAKAVAVGLAAVAHASADPVGVLVAHADGVSRIPPRTRRGTVQELARVLESVRCGGDTQMAPLLAQLPTNARLVFVTDCLGDIDECLKVAAAHGVAGALIECVHIVAQDELVPPGGAHLARDPEYTATGRDATERVLTTKGRAQYEADFAGFRRDVAQRWRSTGAGYTEVVTTVDPARAVRAVVTGLAAAVAPSVRGS